MKFCSKCGKEVMDEAILCVHCGCALEKTTALTEANPADAPNMGLAVLGFLIPLVGLILYLVNKDTFPKKAHSAGKGALIGFCTSLAFYLFYFIIVGVVLATL